MKRALVTGGIAALVTYAVVRWGKAQPAGPAKTALQAGAIVAGSIFVAGLVKKKA